MHQKSRALPKYLQEMYTMIWTEIHEYFDGNYETALTRSAYVERPP